MAEESSTPRSQFQRDDDFADLYANNVRFEVSSWDMKMIFGQLDQSGDEPVVKQHTGITMSWVQAKLLLYFLQVNLGMYELKNGKVRVPADVMPPEPDPLPDELKNQELAKARREYVLRLREKLVADSA